MKHNLDHISNKAESVRMTSAEKMDMLSNLRAYANANPVRIAQPSIWYGRALSYAAAFVLIVGTGATSFAAEKALPGDTLYAVKTGLNEGVVRILPLGASAKAKVEISMIDRRMGELEKMIVSEKDTPENVDTVMLKIEEHKDEFDAHVVALGGGQDAEAAQIHSELETVVDTHIAVLSEITSMDEEPETDQDPVTQPEPEPEYADPVMQADEVPEDTSVMMASVADDSADADTSVAMRTSLKVAAPLVEEAVMMKFAAEPLDPIVEEVTEFSNLEIKSSRPAASAEIQSTTTLESINSLTTRLREKIIDRAERELRVDLSGDADDATDDLR